MGGRGTALLLVLLNKMPSILHPSLYVTALVTAEPFALGKCQRSKEGEYEGGFFGKTPFFLIP